MYLEDQGIDGNCKWFQKWKIAYVIAELIDRNYIIFAKASQFGFPTLKFPSLKVCKLLPKNGILSVRKIAFITHFFMGFSVRGIQLFKI